MRLYRLFTVDRERAFWCTQKRRWNSKLKVKVDVTLLILVSLDQVSNKILYVLRVARHYSWVQIKCTGPEIEIGHPRLYFYLLGAINGHLPSLKTLEKFFRPERSCLQNALPLNSVQRPEQRRFCSPPKLFLDSSQWTAQGYNSSVLFWGELLNHHYSDAHGPAVHYYC